MGARLHVLWCVGQGCVEMLSPTKQASIAKAGPFYRQSDYSSPFEQTPSQHGGACQPGGRRL